MSSPRTATRALATLLAAAALGACSTLYPDRGAELDARHGEPQARSRVQVPGRPALAELTERWLEVEDVMDRRCVVCHACYDAACQLKLTSPAGIERGASDESVYEVRLTPDRPTRLYVDEPDVAGWRARGFHPALNERERTPEAAAESGLIHRMLSLKAAHPLPVASNERLPADTFELGVAASAQCPSVEQFDGYAESHPLAGMPYALPALADDEARTLTDWLERGAPMVSLPPVAGHAAAIAEWETFLNGDTDKERLIARYLYEHLFLAHLHFDELDGEAWYRLVRSRTPPGEPISIVGTRLPFQDPGVERVWYRLWRDPETVVAKSHLPWALDPARMAWIRALFHDAPFEVTRLPGYERRVASNPFLAFEELPARSRYRFMLEEARYTIMGFMKGPVCRGQVALNVIQDHFWVFFVDPENQSVSELDGFLMEQAHNLRFPAGRRDVESLLSVWNDYAADNRRYLEAKMHSMSASRPDDAALGLEYVWDGDGRDADAALTVFRHFDSASVTRGLVGEPPKTAWLINYPLLERIHYLLVAEFDVFGSAAHQLATRTYMDFLRQEGETAFLTLLPKEERERVQAFWYRGASEAMREHMHDSMAMLDGVDGVALRTDEPQAELYDLLRERLAPVLGDEHALDAPAVPPAHREALARLGALRGREVAQLPETALLSIESVDGTYRLYSVLRHRAHANLTSLFAEKRTLLPDEDYLTVARGVIGDYPGAFWRVEEDDLERFAAAAAGLDSPLAYDRFMRTWGVRRSHEDFWRHADRVHDAFARAEPVNAGLLDFNRLENR